MDDLTPLHEDRWLLVVHKPAGLLVHPSALDAHAETDLLTLLQTQRGERLWPAHRLDKGTSGLLVLARDAASASALGQAFAQGQVHKRYLALVRGWPADSGLLDYPLARDPELPATGQPRLPASTAWQVLQRHSLPLSTRAGFADTRVALVEATPWQGRRHQIRRHFKQLGHPLIGDATHGKGPLNRSLAQHLGMQRLWLHAQHLVLPHPADGRTLHLRAAPGPEWQPWLAAPEAAAQA